MTTSVINILCEKELNKKIAAKLFYQLFA